MDANPVGLGGSADLARLRQNAAGPTAVQDAARHFEALFVQMMLKSMRDASAVFGDSGAGTHRDLFDQQIAVELTRGRGLGVATLLASQYADVNGPES